jgi:hypothetical protein
VKLMKNMEGREKLKKSKKEGVITIPPSSFIYRKTRSPFFKTGGFKRSSTVPQKPGKSVKYFYRKHGPERHCSSVLHIGLRRHCVLNQMSTGVHRCGAVSPQVCPKDPVIPPVKTSVIIRVSMLSTFICSSKHRWDSEIFSDDAELTSPFSHARSRRATNPRRPSQALSRIPARISASSVRPLPSMISSRDFFLFLSPRALLSFFRFFAL